MSTVSSTPTTAPVPSATTRAGERSVEGVYDAPPLHWVGDGFRVAGMFQAIPRAARKLSPFLLLDYHPEYHYAPSARPRGVGVHPHRGFETVTIAWKGRVAHHDSAGHGGVIGPGDVQWMTAASGILHKEYHEAEFAKQGGPFQMAQLWVNLPASAKMSAPRYQPLLASEMGTADLPDGAGSIRVIAGEWNGVRGPAKTVTAIEVYDVRLREGGSLDLPFAATRNVGLLVMEGTLAIGPKQVATENQFVVFEHDGEHVSLRSLEDAHVLVLAGEPIDEPIVQYGPFVMNTEREIVEAFHDFESGRFGHLDD